MAAHLPLYSADKLKRKSILATIRFYISTIVSNPETRNVFFFLLLNISFTGVEFAYGIWSNSLGLTADAVHMLFDSTAIICSLIASVVVTWEPTETFTFGYGRVETLTAFVNALALVFASGNIIWEAIERLVTPEELVGDKLLLVSVLGFLVNIVGIFCFDHGGAHGHAGHSHGPESTCSHSHGVSDHSHGTFVGQNHSHSNEFASHGHSHSNDNNGFTGHSHDHSNGHSHSNDNNGFTGHSHDHSNGHSNAKSHDHAIGISHKGHSHDQRHEHSNSSSHDRLQDHSGHNHGIPHEHDPGFPKERHVKPHEHHVPLLSVDEKGHRHSHSGHSHTHNPLMHGMFLHVLADTLGSAGVIISSLLISWFGWTWADPLCSLFIAALILLSIWPLLASSARVLLQRIPESLDHDLGHIRSRIQQVEGVVAINKIHFWELYAGYSVGSVSVYIHSSYDDQGIRETVASVLRESGLRDITVQIEKGIVR